MEIGEQNTAISQLNDSRNGERGVELSCFSSVFKPPIGVTIIGIPEDEAAETQDTSKSKVSCNLSTPRVELSSYSRLHIAENIPTQYYTHK